MMSEESKRIERIKEMEEILDEAEAALSRLNSALDEYSRLRPRIEKLKEYYAGEWIEDYEADEKGLLPRDLKRGVLSQDSVFDLMADEAAALARMQDLQKTEDRNRI